MASAAPERFGKRSGAVQFEHFQKDDYQKRLDPVVERLNESIDGFMFDRKNLATVLAGLQQFMEDALGVNAPNKPFPKMPSKLFRDFNPDGPLTTIGRLCAELMKAKGQRRIDWANPANRKENTDLVLRIRQELIRGGHMRLPRVFVLPDCPNASMLRHTVTKLGGELSHAEDAPGVTHVVCPYGPNGDPDDGQEYLRTLDIAGGAARVHWWYLPDSYDEWLPAAAAPADVDPDLKPPGGRPWRVYWRYLTDAEKYNEWMNEADYETEEAAAENKRAREAGEGDAEAARETKRARKSTVAPEVAPGNLESLGPGVATRRLLNPLQKAFDGGRVEDVSHGQRQEWGGVPVGVVPEGGTGALAALHRVPAKASWFKYGAVHQLEQDEFPEIFGPSGGNDGRSTPTAHQQPTQQYLTVRSHLIGRFREDPGRELTFVEALKGLDGDANMVRKVYDFLARWGIINWRDVGPGAAPVTLDGAAGSGGVAAPAGIAGIVNLPRGARPAEAAEAAATGSTSRATVRRGTFHAAAPQPPAVATGARFMCNAHPWEEVTELRYHCTKVPDVDLCPAAFAEGRFPPGCCSKDFVRVAATDAVKDASGWSDQETLLLLEGMEKFGEDWAAVSEHVGGRSQLECVQRLLQLPIDDVLAMPQHSADAGVELAMELDVGEGDIGGGGTENGGGAGAGPSVAGPMPFADAGNPVMAQVAFLATMVGPRVAAAAAQRAMEVLADEDGGSLKVEQDGAEEGNGAGHVAVEAAPSEGVPEKRTRAAAAAGLAAAAVKARLMADAEEREMQRLVMAACDMQLRRVNAKLAVLEKMDDLMKGEMGPQAARAAEYEKELAALKALPAQGEQPQQQQQQQAPGANGAAASGAAVSGQQ